MAKKNHHLLKRGDSWYLQAMVNGHRIRQALSKDVTKARDLRDKLLEELRWGQVLNVGNEGQLFGEVVMQWVEVVKKRLRPSTLRGYRSIMNYHLLPKFGNMVINEILPVDIEKFMATRDCEAKRVNNILGPLRSLFRFAKKNGYVERNIMLDVENLPMDKPQIHPLSMGEVTAFLNAVNPHYRSFFVVAFFTGLRLGEQIALKWNASDWERKKIRIAESRVMGIDGRPKTKGSYRDLDMLPIVEAALSGQRRRNGLKSQYVFLNTEGDPIDGETLRKWTWTPGLKKAGLAYRSMYQTRHTFASLMIPAGEDLGWVQRMMGHSSLRMILERYHRFIPNLTHADGSAFQQRFRDALAQITPKLPQPEAGPSRDNVIPLNDYKK